METIRFVVCVILALCGVILSVVALIFLLSEPSDMYCDIDTLIITKAIGVIAVFGVYGIYKIIEIVDDYE